MTFDISFHPSELINLLFFTRVQFRARVLCCRRQYRRICGNLQRPGRLRHWVCEGKRMCCLDMDSLPPKWKWVSDLVHHDSRIWSIDKMFQYCFSESSETYAGWWKRTRTKGIILIGWGARLATVRDNCISISHISVKYQSYISHISAMDPGFQAPSPSLPGFPHPGSKPTRHPGLGPGFLSTLPPIATFNPNPTEQVATFRPPSCKDQHGKLREVGI